MSERADLAHHLAAELRSTWPRPDLERWLETALDLAAEHARPATGARTITDLVREFDAEGEA